MDFGGSDIKINEGNIVRANNGDSYLVIGKECILQNIKLEAISNEGELWYEENWGWGLSEFLQGLDDEINMLAITQRIKEKLSMREYINPESIVVYTNLENEKMRVTIIFNFVGDDNQEKIELDLSREVKSVD